MGPRSIAAVCSRDGAYKVKRANVRSGTGLVECWRWSTCEWNIGRGRISKLGNAREWRSCWTNDAIGCDVQCQPANGNVDPANPEPQGARPAVGMNLIYGIERKGGRTWERERMWPGAVGWDHGPFMGWEEKVGTSLQWGPTTQGCSALDRDRGPDTRDPRSQSSTDEV